MKMFGFSLTATKSLAAIMMLAVFATHAQAAAKITLKGEADDVKYETDAGIRLSIIDWSSAEQQQAVEKAWRQYQQDNDLESFLASVEAQESRGYIFTAAATGYRIKYAWKEDTDNGQMMHFLVTPGLKTRNPYLWETPNNVAPEFTLVQVHLDNETGVAKSSLDGEIMVNEQGKLALDRFDSVKRFASVEDATPYYLK